MKSGLTPRASSSDSTRGGVTGWPVTPSAGTRYRRRLFLPAHVALFFTLVVLFFTEELCSCQSSRLRMTGFEGRL